MYNIYIIPSLVKGLLIIISLECLSLECSFKVLSKLWVSIR